MTNAERELFDKALTALMCALAHDEAVRSGAESDELTKLRGYWVEDAAEVIEQAEKMGLYGDYDDE